MNTPVSEQNAKRQADTAKESLRAAAITSRFRSTEPLLDEVPILNELLDRFVGMLDEAPGDLMQEHVEEIQQFFVRLQDKINKEIETAHAQSSADNTFEKDLVAELAMNTCRQIKTIELALLFGRNGYLAPDLYKRVRSTVDQLSIEVSRNCTEAATILLEASSQEDYREPSSEIQTLKSYFNQLSIVPTELPLRIALAFEYSDDYVPEKGDILYTYNGQMVVLEPGEQNHDSANQLSAHTVRYRLDNTYRENTDDRIDPESIFCISRGGEEWVKITAEDRIYSGLIWRKGVRVSRKTPQGDLLRGEVMGVENDTLSILWYNRSVAQGVERIPITVFSDLDNLGLDLFDQDAEIGYHDLPTADCVTERILQALHSSLVTDAVPAAVDPDYAGNSLRQICQKVLLAPLPIYLETSGPCYGSAEEAISDILEQTVGGDLPEELAADPKTLRRHYCTPVMVVTGCDGDVGFERKMEKLRLAGWEIVLWQNPSAVNDPVFNRYCQKKFGDAADNDNHSLHLVEGTTEDFKQYISKLAEERKTASRTKIRPASEDSPIPDLENEFERWRQSVIASCLPQLLALSDMELSDGGRPASSECSHDNPLYIAAQIGRALEDASSEIREKCLEHAPSLSGLRQLVDSIDSEEISSLHSLKELLSQLETAEQISSEAENMRGRTTIEDQLTPIELLKISAELARSRLPVDHPGISFRGITCGDLSPMALQELLESGALYTSVRSEQGELDGLVITLNPELTEKLRPGLSEQLGYPAKTGYLLWIWVNPDAKQRSSSVYPKLVNAFLADQLLHGASFAVGRAFERNIPSLCAAVGVAGFEIIPWLSDFYGEPMVGLGLDLNEFYSPNLQRERISAKNAYRSACEVFLHGAPTGNQHSSEHEASRQRIEESLQFVDNLIAVRLAWDNLELAAQKTVRWSPLEQAVSRLEDCLKTLEHQFPQDQISRCYFALGNILVEERRSESLQDFAELFNELIPEGIPALRRTRRNILRRIAGDDSLADIALRYSAERSVQDTPDLEIENEPKKEAVSLSPAVDAQKALERYPKLGERFKRLLWSFSDSVLLRCHVRPLSKDDDGSSYRWFRNHMAQIMEERGRIISEESCRDLLQEAYTPEDIAHALELSQLVAYANQLAREDLYDHKAATRIYRLLRSYLHGYE